MDAHALIVGIAGYRRVTPLPETVLDDAREIARVLKDPDLCGYPPDNVRLLLDEDASLAGLRGALAELATVTSAQGTVFLYVSSHGGRIAEGEHAGEYIVPFDADWSSEASIAASAMSGGELTEALRAIPARKLVVVFDCCHAGGIGQPKEVGPTRIGVLADSLYTTLASGVGRVIIASSRSDESSYVLPGAANSLFTQHLLAAIRGGAPARRRRHPHLRRIPLRPAPSSRWPSPRSIRSSRPRWRTTSRSPCTSAGRRRSPARQVPASSLPHAPTVSARRTCTSATPEAGPRRLGSRPAFDRASRPPA